MTQALHSTLTVMEHQRCNIVENPSDRNEVSPGFADKLEKLQNSLRLEIADIGRRHLKFKQYVGTIRVGNQIVEILPKIDSRSPVSNEDNDDLELRRRTKLIQMLYVSKVLPSHKPIAASLSRSTTMLDAYLNLFINELITQWRRGVPMDYERIEQNRTALKGKILFSNHLRENLVRRDRFFTSFSERSSDTTLNQLFLAALNAVARVSSASSVRRSAIDLMFEFDGVSNRYVPPSEIEALLLDRRFNRFRNLIQQASLILQGFVPGRSGQEDAMSLLFDMNRVFESCIGNIASRVVRNYGGMATLQMSGRSLLYLGEARRSKFLLKPDIGIHTDCIRSVPPLAIIDTKWKTLKPDAAHKGVSQADMYQMYAYGVRYNCPKVILLYPHIDDMSDLTATYHHEKHEDGCTIYVETIDLSDRMTGDSAGSVEWQLKQLFERLGISNQIAAKNRTA